MNRLYAHGREGFLDGSVNWQSGVIKLVLLDNGYVFSDTHRHVSDLGTHVIATSGALSGKTSTLGVARANSIRFESTPNDRMITSMALIQASSSSGGSDLASTAQRLVMFFNDVNGFSMYPSGGPLIINWGVSVNGIFQL